MIGYKYRANVIEEDNYLRDINSVLKDELWASSFDNLNDPFEATYVDDMTKELSIIEQAFKVDMINVQSSWNGIMELKKSLGIYSLSLSEKDYPSHKLMWTHYADSHHGFCIAYDIEKLIDSEPLLFNVDHIKVKYVEGLPQIGIRDVAQRANLMEKLFGTKTKDWEYEKEIRLLYTNYGIKHYSPFALKAIYFGLHMSEQYQNLIIDGLQNRDVKFYKMSKVEGSYELSPIFICENKRKIEAKLPLDSYEILKTDHNHTTENFHVLYKGSQIDEDTLQRFSSGFREEYATKQANIYLYDDKGILDLIGKYPLFGDDKQRLANHLIAVSMFDVLDEVWLYPYK